MLQILKERLGIESLHKEPLKCEITDGFLLPIQYLQQEHIQRVNPTVLADLEYVTEVTKTRLEEERQSVTSEAEKSGEHNNKETKTVMTDYLMGSETHAFQDAIVKEAAQKYTCHKEYLEQTQLLIRTMDKLPEPVAKAQVDEFSQIWRDIKEDADFLNKHSFLEWKTFEELNKSKMFLQIYSFFNILSPMFSLMMPLVLMLLPFLLIKLQGIPITLEQYVITLKEIAKSHFLGKALSIQDMSVESVLYFLFILAMYALQTYQNVMACIRYYKCVQRMNGNLCALYTYLRGTIGRMDKFVALNNRASLQYYADFCQDVFSHKLVLEDIYVMIGGDLTPFCLHPKKLGDMGHMMYCYYQLYRDVDMEESLRYAAGFDGYYSMMWALHRGVQSGRLGLCSFLAAKVEDIEVGEEEKENAQGEEGKEEEDGEEKETDQGDDKKETEKRNQQPITIFHDQYYPPHYDGEKRVVNTVDLSNNIIITGVNASGKTTTLKSTAINILTSQQFGVGFYASAQITPFHHIHSYLNIPDTSGRDSLFQAESRRCKEILDKIGETPPSDRHFCLFDELYSGTNPKEATKSAISLLRFLASKENVRFMLTTHYVDVCTQLGKDKGIVQYQMEVILSSSSSSSVEEDDEEVEEKKETTTRIEEYTYRLIPGISLLEGGIEILKNLNYPKEIIQNILTL